MLGRRGRGVVRRAGDDSRARPSRWHTPASCFPWEFLGSHWARSVLHEEAKGRHTADAAAPEGMK
jgi:hypothetical protein